jgi:hypothetical protein
MATQATELRESIPKLEERLIRDQRNLSILASDYQLPHELVLVPDCADLVNFLHISNYEEPLGDSYGEAIKRYFLSDSERAQLVLIPSWAFEFVNYLHRVVHKNIGRFALIGGFEAFMAAYPAAKRFYELWQGKEREEAIKLYIERDVWAQILNLTRAERLEAVLGNALSRFVALTDSGKLRSITEYLNTRGMGSAFDAATFRIATGKLAEMRPKPDQTENNEIDAMSLAIVKWANDEASRSGSFFTAVTRSREALLAFYATIDSEELGRGGTPMLSLARSSISTWLDANVKAAAGDKKADFVQRGIELSEELLALCRDVQGSLPVRASASGPVPLKDVAAAKKLEGSMWGLYDHYSAYYREPIFRPVEKYGRRGRDDSDLGLEAEEAAEILSPAKFQEAMRSARERLAVRPQEAVQRVEPFVRDAWSLKVGGERLDSRYRNILLDFERDVF